MLHTRRSSHADHKMRDLVRDFAGALYATPAQAAEELGRSIHTLAKWRKDGNGPPWTRHQNGWGILYDREGLMLWKCLQGARHNRFTRLRHLKDSDFLTERQAAAILCVSQSTMVLWRKQGRITPRAVPSDFNLGGKMYLYALNEVEALAERITLRRGLGRGRGSATMLSDAAATPSSASSTFKPAPQML